MKGFVSLVGAGPGDPELLTLRAVNRLREADLVLYDALVDKAALRYAPHARWAYVGKRAGRHSLTQETIERVMIRRALQGEKIVRLKSGDPFVFGRGGEEALALARAGIACEVVPGVSAAIAAPALSNIPVTHRGLSTAFVVVSGHAPEAYTEVLSALVPGSLTVVLLMGIATRAATARLLIERGWALDTPAAVLFAASRAESASWRGTLATLPLAPASEAEAPGVIVIGATVNVAAELETIKAQNLALNEIGDANVVAAR
jgi:uroporphyrin-III C-methyltransferase/precorrin-2 dehydrogenase/sirohydrochlorin ferrochelatase